MSKELIDKFLKQCATTIEDWEFWQKEHKINDKIIVAGPSRIIALVDLTKLEGDIVWTPYTPISKPSKKMSGCFTYDKHIYSIYFLRDDVFKFIGESIEIGLYKEAMLFKLTETIALGLAPKLIENEYYFNNEGVMFVNESWEEDKSTSGEREFVKWVDNKAKWKHNSKAGEWFEEVYKFEKFFEEEEDMGDFLDI
jgi:hypothetical protein